MRVLTVLRIRYMKTSQTLADNNLTFRLNWSSARHQNSGLGHLGGSRENEEIKKNYIPGLDLSPEFLLHRDRFFPFHH